MIDQFVHKYVTCILRFCLHTGLWTRALRVLETDHIRLQFCSNEKAWEEGIRILRDWNFDPTTVALVPCLGCRLGE